MPDTKTFQSIYATREAARKMLRLSKITCFVVGKLQNVNTTYRMNSTYTTDVIFSVYGMLEERQAIFDLYTRYYETHRHGSETPRAYINTRLQDFVDAHFFPDVPPRDSLFKDDL